MRSRRVCLAGAMLFGGMENDGPVRTPAPTRNTVDSSRGGCLIRPDRNQPPEPFEGCSDHPSVKTARRETKFPAKFFAKLSFKKADKKAER